MLLRILFLPLLLLPAVLLSQVKTLEAIRINHPPKIDGNLDDDSWKDVAPAANFIQSFPTFGQASSQHTVVKVTYDDAAIYVGAYLYDDPTLIRRQITARDEEAQTDVDYFSIFFDTYNDHQNGYQFLVTSANVQTDSRLGPNLGDGFGSYGDQTWDAVWESKTSTKADGWVVEMRIPYISLRFAKKDLQDWGIQLLRFTRRNNERDFWNPVDPNINGFVNQFGSYRGLQNLQPPLRLSLSPYVSTGVRSTPESNTSARTEWLRSGGMDVKYGINESFTLDATLIPDFGQVVSDNVVNNLTPYEVRFQENRPFFTEGTELFNKSGLFYSRRIGAVPGGYSAINNMVGIDPNLEIVKNPGVTQLYNAVKFSGRTKKKLGIGIFNAIAAPAEAIVRDKTTGIESRYQTEPLANYNIIVLDQALKGRSYVTFTNTNVIRNGAGRDANVSAFDFSFFDKTNTYQFKGTARYSKIFTANPYDGYNTTLNFGKVSGHVQYFLQGTIKSDGYNPRDLGFLATNNETVVNGSFSYTQFTQTKSFLTYRYALTSSLRRLYKPNAFEAYQVEASAFWWFRNFWDVTLAAGYLPDQHDYFVIGAPYQYFARRPSYGYLSLRGSSDSRKRLFFSYQGLIGDFFKVKDKSYHILDLGLRYRFSNKFTLELSNRNEAESNYIVYQGAEGNGKPIIGFVDFQDVTSILSGIYNFTPRINVTLRTRHYWSKVNYNRFANVDADGNAIARPFIAGQDQNVNVLNTDAFLTWDFRPGSRIIVGYKNWLGDGEDVSGMSYKKYLANFGQTFSLKHGNEFTVRFIYYLDYNQLKRKR
jgi:hypothetical protein